MLGIKEVIENEDEDALVTVGISIPVCLPEENNHYLDTQQYISAIASDPNNNFKSSDASHSFQFKKLHSSLDPNLGMLGTLSSANILYEKTTFNSWNIEPHFLYTLPQSTTNIDESSILLFGGLNLSSVSNKELSYFDHEDFVLGSTIFQYSLNSAVWKYYGTMIEPRCYHACVLLGQYVYIIGGYSLLKRACGEMIAVPSTDRLDLNAGQWKRCANMITARAAHAAVSHNSSLYVFGGRNSLGEILSSVEVYYPDQDMWIEITSLPQPTMGLSAACALDKIWLLGGITTINSTNPSKSLLSDVVSFDPSIKRWTIEESLPHPCAYSVCISNGHSLWMIGGCTFSNESKTVSLASSSSVLKLVVCTGPSKWKSVASLLQPRHALTAILYDESIYILGGMESSIRCTTNKVEVINLTTNMSIECSNIPVAITGSASVPICFDTKVYKCIKCFKMFSQPRISLDFPHIEDDFYSMEKNLNLNTSKLLKDIRESDTVKHTSSNHDTCNLETVENTHQSFQQSVKELETKSIKNLETHESLKVQSHEDPIEMEIRESDTVKHTSSNHDTCNLETVENTHQSFQQSVKELETKSIKNLETHESLKVQSHEDPIEMDIGTELKDMHSKEKEDRTIKHRASMEIFLSSIMASKETDLNLLRKRKSATEWLKYYNSLMASDEMLQTESLRSKESIDIQSLRSYKKEYEVNYVSELKSDSNSKIATKLEKKHQDLVQDHIVSTSGQNAMSCSQQSLLYIQSSLKSQSFPTQPSTDDSFSATETSELKKDSELAVSCDAIKISVTQEVLPIILIVGGEDPSHSTKGRYILLYECNQDLWKYVGYMPEYRCHHCAVYFKHKFYVIGGFDSEDSTEFKNITKKIICYDILDEMWYDKASMNHSRAYHSAVILNDEIWVLGGRNQLGNILTSIEIYNESRDEWREHTLLPYPVLGAAIAAVHDTLYIFGGVSYIEENEIVLSTTAVLECQNNRWKTGPELYAPLAFCGIAAFSNSICLFGGLKVEHEDIVSAKDVFKFDIETGTWSKIAELSVPRHAPMTVSLGAKVYVIGGYSTQVKMEVTTCEEMSLINSEVCLMKHLPIAVSGKAGAVIAEFDNNNE